MIQSRLPLYLGIEIEEVYMPFGESFMLEGPGLDPVKYESFERKAQRVREALLSIGVSKRLVRRFEDFTSRAHRSGDPLPDGMDFDSFFLMVMGTSRDLGGLMEDVRKELNETDATLYDLGIMLARFDLCLRALRLADSGLDLGEGGDYGEFLSKKHDIYQKELARVVPTLTNFVEDAMEQAQLPETLDRELLTSLAPFAEHLRRWEEGSTEWRRIATSHAYDIFTSLGFVTQVNAPQVGARESSESSNDQLLVAAQQSRSRHYERALEGDLDGAEEGQRRLIEETRHTFGPAHELTLNVRNDLALTFLLQGKGDLAADRAYDVVSDAERAHGPRSATTAYEQVRTLQILMATRNVDEVLDFYQSRLQWLADSDPDDLEIDLIETRSELLELFERQDDRPEKPRRRFWRRKG